MLLYIHDNRTLKELQDDFHLAFPYLRLEFFSQPHAVGIASVEKTKLNAYMQLIAVRSSHRNGAIEIKEWHTVKAVEQILQQDYKLPVQIYHYTRAGWIETTVTDDVTLNELNEQGKREATEAFNPPISPRSFQ